MSLHEALLRGQPLHLSSVHAPLSSFTAARELLIGAALTHCCIPSLLAPAEMILQGPITLLPCLQSPHPSVSECPQSMDSLTLEACSDNQMVPHLHCHLSVAGLHHG